MTYLQYRKACKAEQVEPLGFFKWMADKTAETLAKKKLEDSK